MRTSSDGGREAETGKDAPDVRLPSSNIAWRAAASPPPHNFCASTSRTSRRPMVPSNRPPVMRYVSHFSLRNAFVQDSRRGRGRHTRGVVEWLMRALQLRCQVVENALPGGAARVASRGRRERVGVLAHRGRPVDLHRSQRGVRGDVASVVEYHGRGRASAEGSGGVPVRELGRHRERKVSLTTASIGGEEGA